MAEVVKEEVKPDPSIEMLKTVQDSQRQLAAAIQGINQQLASMPKAAPAPVVPKKTATQTYLIDEEKGLEQLKVETKEEVKKEIREEYGRTQRMAEVAADLRTRWPELLDDASPMTQETLKHYYGLPKHEQTPAAMELSAVKASAKLGLKPSTERGEPEEADYVVGAPKGAPKQSRSGKGTKKDDKLDPRTEDFAVLLGRDPEKVKPFDRRETWGKYRGRGEQ